MMETLCITYTGQVRNGKMPLLSPSVETFLFTKFPDNIKYQRIYELYEYNPFVVMGICRFRRTKYTPQWGRTLRVVYSPSFAIIAGFASDGRYSEAYTTLPFVWIVQPCSNSTTVIRYSIISRQHNRALWRDVRSQLERERDREREKLIYCYYIPVLRLSNRTILRA